MSQDGTRRYRIKDSKGGIMGSHELIMFGSEYVGHLYREEIPLELVEKLVEAANHWLEIKEVFLMFLKEEKEKK